MIGIHCRPNDNDCYDEFCEWAGMETVHWSQYKGGDAACLMQDPIGARKRKAVDGALNCNMNNAVRDYSYPVWREAGLRCPQVYDDFPDYPFIVKETRKQMGRAYFIDSNQRLDWLLMEAKRYNPDRFKPIEYIDTRFPDGKYRMHRYIVCGDQGKPAALSVTNGWLSKGSKMKSFDMDEYMQFWNSECPQEVIQAVQLLDLDFGLVDCTVTDNGIVFWEVNPYMNLRLGLVAGKRERWWPMFSNYLLGTTHEEMPLTPEEVQREFDEFEGYEGIYVPEKS